VKVDGLERAFHRVRSSAEKVLAGDGSARDGSYEEIFALNNEIGMIARQQPNAMPKMKELQGYVNMITVGMKYDRPAEIREGLAVTESFIQELKARASP
jgi:hypothetical protein